MEMISQVDEHPPQWTKTASLARLAVVVAALSSVQLLLAFLNDIVPWNMWAVLACLVFVAFLAKLVHYAPATVVVMLPFIFFSATEIGSCAAIESGAWMEELGEAGFPTGGTARRVIALMVFCGVGAFIIEPAWRAKRQRSIREEIQATVKYASLPITVACLLFFGYLVYVGLRKGFPFFNGTERLDFRYEASDPVFTSLLGNSTLFTVASSLLAAAPSTRSRGIALSAGIFLVQVLFGEKLGPLVVTAAIFSAPLCLVVLSEDNRLPLAKMAYAGSVIGAITLILCLNIYAYLHGGYEVATTKLLERMAEQGEMWYVGDRDFRGNLKIDWEIVSKEVSACLGWRSQNPKEIGADFGPMIVMQQYDYKNKIETTIEKQIYFVFTYSTYWLMVSGYPGFAFVSFLTSIAYGIAGRLFLNGLVNGNLLGALLGQKCMWMVNSAFVTGWTMFAFGYKTAVVFFAAWLVVYAYNVFQIQSAQVE